MELIIIALGILTGTLNEISKRVDKLPTTSSNAKVSALVIGLVLTLGYEYLTTGTLRADMSVLYATETVTVTAIAIATYESVKNLIRKEN